MSWELLPTDYTDATWAGLKRYNQVDNEDGTVSFEDVTTYTGKDKSFFGSKEANRMNEALNTIMSMVENGTDLYEAFQTYFATQKTLFKTTADATQAEFTDYTDDLKTQGDTIINGLESTYKTEIDTFERTQENSFNTWFSKIQGQLDTDAAGKLQNEIDALTTDVNTVSANVDKVDAAVKAKPDVKDYTATLLADGWSDTAPYTQSVSFGGTIQKADTEPILALDMSNATTDTAEDLQTAWSCVGRATAEGSTLTVYCYTDKPEIDIPVMMKVVE